MQYTKWNLRKAKDLLNKLIDDPNPKSKEDIQILVDILKNDITLFPTSENFQEKIADDKKLINKYSEFNTSLLKYSEYKKQLPSPKSLCFEPLNIKDIDLISYVHDFYHSIDFELAHLFDKVFKDRKNNLKFSNERSMNIYLPYSKYAFINVERQDTIADFESIVHEYAHVIQDQIAYYPNHTYNPFVELAPIFFSMISINEIDDWFIGLEEEKNAYLLYNAREIANLTNILKIYIDYFTSDEIPKKNVAVNEIAANIDKTKHKVEQILDLSLTEVYAYSIPYLIAIELYNIYLLDQEKALYILKELITYNKEKNYLSILNDNHIILNNHTDDYIKTLKK